MNNPTETLDKMYLEWSQFTNARTKREALAEKDAREIAELLSADNPNVEIARALANRIAGLCRA